VGGDEISCVLDRFCEQIAAFLLQAEKPGRPGKKSAVSQRGAFTIGQAAQRAPPKKTRFVCAVLGLIIPPSQDSTDNLFWILEVLRMIPSIGLKQDKQARIIDRQII
jgi:hypothetical protein